MARDGRASAVVGRAGRLLGRLARVAEAATATERAIGLTETPAARAFSIARLAEVAAQAGARGAG